MRKNLGYLSAFYLVQGLPFGFQAKALPMYLRTSGVSLTHIGFAQALAMPWMLKALWAPVVDRYGSPTFGRRRSWIAPMQAAIALSCLAAALVPPDSGLVALLVLVLLMNLFAATMDIAVDGLAVDVLSEEHLGYGNIAQVVGYKLGMLAGGGLLVWMAEETGVGWRGLFTSMAAVVALVLLATLRFREPPPTSGPERQTVGEVLRALGRAMKVPGAGWLLLFIGTYKLGESMADSMFTPFLVDAGFEETQIALWQGVYSMVFSIAGSFAGGVLASRTSLFGAVALTATLRAVSVGGEWWLSVVTPTAGSVIAVTCTESFCGGALTTAMFAFMMSRVDRRIGGTHYTVLATVEVLGKTPAAWLSGVFADRWGFPAVFGAATVLSVAFLGLLLPLQKARVRSHEQTVDAAGREPEPEGGVEGQHQPEDDVAP